jgi:hypothetical protein
MFNLKALKALKALKLWYIKRQIAHLEERELELKASLRYLQGTLLPNARSKHNNLVYGTTRYVREGWR